MESQHPMKIGELWIGGEYVNNSGQYIEIVKRVISRPNFAEDTKGNWYEGETGAYVTWLTSPLIPVVTTNRHPLSINLEIGDINPPKR